MTTLSIPTADAKEEFSDLINRVSNDKVRIILTRRGKEIAAIVPLEDYLTLQKSQSKSDLQEALEALKEAREAGSITLDDLKIKTG